MATGASEGFTKEAAGAKGEREPRKYENRDLESHFLLSFRCVGIKGNEGKVQELHSSGKAFSHTVWSVGSAIKLSRGKP